MLNSSNVRLQSCQPVTLMNCSDINSLCHCYFKVDSLFLVPNRYTGLFYVIRLTWWLCYFQTPTQKPTQLPALICGSLYLLQKQKVNSFVHHFHVLIGLNSGLRRNRYTQMVNTPTHRYERHRYNQNHKCTKTKSETQIFSHAYSSFLSFLDWTHWTQWWPCVQLPATLFSR